MIEREDLPNTSEKTREDIEEERGTAVHVKALIPGDEGEVEVASDYFGVQITRDYYAIELKDGVEWPDNLEIGD